jgi:GTPase Era involved in 16S rRNA processing
MRMAELIREKILYHTEQEVPHAVAVIIESIEIKKKTLLMFQHSSLSKDQLKNKF